MNLYRIIGKNGNWIANVTADRMEWVNDGAIHFYNATSNGGEVYVAGFFPDVEVELDKVKLQPLKVPA